MRDNKSLPDNLLEEGRESLDSASSRNSGIDSSAPTGPHAAHHDERNPRSTFKPLRINLTPDAPVNMGYVGGVRMPKKRA